MIRDAAIADIPRLVELGRAMHVESPQWSRMNFDETRVATKLTSLIANEQGLLLVAESQGAPVGGVAVMAAAHWSSFDLVADEIAFFLLPDFRGSRLAVELVRRMDAWAFKIGCTLLRAGTTTGVGEQRTVQFYERLGFVHHGTVLERFYGEG